MVMILNHPIVRAYLLAHGLVYTFRKHHPKTADGVRIKTGKDWATNKRCGKKIVDIRVTPIEHIDSLNMGQVLTKYVRESGFYAGHGRVDYAVVAWAHAINSMNPDEPTRGWIYQVEVREADD